MLKKLALAAVAVAALTGAAQAAVQATQTMQVQAMVTPTCSLGGVGTFDFGVIGGTASAYTPASTSFNVTCSAGLAYTVKITSAVGNVSGTRRMVEPGINQTMDYFLEWFDTNTSAWSVWNDTSFVTKTGNSAAQALNFRGTIPIQAPSGGAWQLSSQFIDTVTIIVEN